MMVYNQGNSVKIEPAAPYIASHPRKLQSSFLSVITAIQLTSTQFHQPKIGSILA
jgi:hypothetical protein